MSHGRPAIVVSNYGCNRRLGSETSLRFGVVLLHSFGNDLDLQQATRRQHDVAVALQIL
jgi:hypothetical protein